MATGSCHGSLSADQLAAVMQAVKEGMRDEISSLKRELASDREAADERLVKKLKLEKVPTFKKKTHEKQILFNEEVAAKFEGGTVCLSEAPPAVEKVKTLLEEGMKLVRERQKLIRMADRSEHGWAMVEEYLEDELADDSDDEKRIQKAEFRAGRKLKATAAKNAKKKSGLMQSRLRRAGKYPSLAGPPPTQYSGVVQGLNQHVAGSSPYKWSPGVVVVGAASAAGPPLQGPCFNCGRVGHVKKFCPLLQASCCSNWKVMSVSSLVSWSHDYVGYSVI